MEYKGKLYGKVGGEYFDTGRTTDDWDELEASADQVDAIVMPIETAPRDGTEIIGIYKDGTEELIWWNEDDRYCMLGRRNGSYPPGWSPASDGVDSNLPLDDEEIIKWKEA